MERESHIDRRRLIGLAAASPLLSTLGCASDSRGERPRNLVVLVADDQSRLDVPAYGRATCRTPHLDRLAREGARFERFYTPVPLCQPARACLYTGVLPHRNGVFAFEDVRPGVATWPELLRGHATTAMIGKLNAGPRARFAFDHTVELKDEQGRSPEAYERATAEFLSAAAERPFAAVINFNDPHRPFGEGGEGGEAREPHDPKAVWVPPFLWDTPETRVDLAKYYDALARMDEAIGRVLALLEPLAGDTLVIFTSDNGAPFPFAKTTLYEAGINLPFIARWPGVVQPGSAVASPTSLLDLLPTALEVFGVEADGPRDGRSLLPLLRGEPVEERPIVGWITATRAGHYPTRSIRLGDTKYVRNFEPRREFVNSVMSGSRTWASWEALESEKPALRRRMRRLRHRPAEELYDLASDPHELADLAGDASRADELERVRGELRAWMESAEDRLLAKW
jgi:arylsulfatase A-like enzyme